MDAVTGLSDSMKKDLKRELQAVMLNEPNARAAAKRFKGVVNSTFANTYKNRLDVIATTEMNNVFNSAAQATYKDSGVVEFNLWITAGDDRVRPSHAATHGEVVKVGNQFSLGVIRPPQGPRCRCGLIPYFPDDKNMKRI